jgi:hypothetical protein
MGSVSFRDSINSLIISTDTSGYAYTNINKPVNGTYVSPTTVVFNATWLPAPGFLPPTSLDNFTFFVNGLNIEKQAIVSFTEVVNTSVLVIDPSILQFSFDQSDVILAIGKFN